MTATLPRRRLFAGLGLLVAVELAVVALYASLPGVGVIAPRYLLYPFVWVDVAIVAVATVHAPDAGRRTRLAAAAAAVGYFLVLTWVDGTVALMHASDAPTVDVVWLPPGWGPTLRYAGPFLHATVVPFTTVGYAALAYLVYAALLEARTAAAGGLVGLLSCVSCTLPVAAALLSGVTGGAAAVAATATGLSYDLSTLVFVVAVALLYWRPSSAVLWRRVRA